MSVIEAFSDIWDGEKGCEASSSTSISRVASIDYYYNPSRNSFWLSTNTNKDVFLMPTEEKKLSAMLDAGIRNSYLAVDKDSQIVKRNNNINLLSEMLHENCCDAKNYVSEKTINNALIIIFYLSIQPSIYKTYENSIHMQYETENRSYLEFEVFEDRITSMMVPFRNYQCATFPNVTLNDSKGIDRIVKEFYEFT